MVDNNDSLDDSIDNPDLEDGTPKIYTRPLPEILDEMDTGIRSATQAAKQAVESAQEAKEAEAAAVAAAREASIADYVQVWP